MTTSSDPRPGADGVRIRQVERADLLAVHRIERASFQSPWPLDAFDRYVSDPGFLVAVADDPPCGAGTDAAGGPDDADDRGTDAVDAIDAASIVGYVVADTVPNHGRPLGHVKDIAVHPDYRGNGVGSRLLARALVVLADENAQSVKLEVRRGNESARSLYREFGFEPLRRVPRYYDDGEDAVIMVRRLGE